MNLIVCRLITPGEMDLMARIAGLHLVDAQLTVATMG
jgi:hydroxymethylglutaryl-CoA reductase